MPPIRHPRDAPTNFTKYRDGVGIIVRKPNFDQIPIKRFTVLLYFETAPEKDDVVFDCNSNFRIIRFNLLFCFRE